MNSIEKFNNKIEEINEIVLNIDPEESNFFSSLYEFLDLYK